jgi:hypothetical protein
MIKYNKRKTINLIFTFSVLFCSIVEGSSVNQCGIKVGYLYSEQKVHSLFLGDLDLFDPRSGFSAGFFAEINLWNEFFLLGDLSYMQKGSKYQLLGTRRIQEEPGYTIVEYNYDNRLDYISILLAIGYKYRIDFVSPYIIFGSRIDYLIRGKHVFSEPLPIFDQVNELEKVTYGLSMGGGIEFPKWLPFNLSLEFIYSPDLSNSFLDNRTEITNISYEINLKFGF